MLHDIWKNHRKANRCFELIPGTLEPALEFLSSSSAMAVLENEQLKTVEMNKSVKNVVLSIWTYLSSVSHICIPILRVYLTAHFCQLASVSNFYACLMIHNSYFWFPWPKQFQAICNIVVFFDISWIGICLWKILKNILSKTKANEYYWKV